ncbi:MAG: SUMF1/EgtB/PvdO family nonheme iron enzyme [Planctomycetota bacterium]|nr:SUMF1/EgtB/PvdO family nonheme iron enzyme [Planctomycetota bacterium]
MPGSVSDEAFARAVQQAGVVSYDQLEAAKAAQAASAAKGVLVSLADVLVQQGVMAPATRENIEKKVRALQAGGIKQLGQFKLLKKLGEGGMGAVYLAEDTNAGRMVALKLLPKKHAGDSEFLSRFRREARAAGQLNHVNIVAAHTVGEEMGNHYIVMEYVEGEPLDKTLKRDGALPWDKALEIVMQVARGLKHAHEHGIIHRDIKPGNIIVTPQGVAKILDLGLSKAIGGEEHFNTQTGVAVGTPHYISPEQARGDKNLDGRMDIYSLGATFYHLVTGQTPFEGSTAAVIMTKHLNEQLTNPQDIVEDLPDNVAHVIIKMMAKEPNDRYRDCKELLDDLELVIDGRMPSSQAIDVGKSSVAMARVARPKRPAGVAQVPRRTAGAVPPVGTRQHVPAARTADGTAEPARSGMSVGKYIAIGVAALVALIFVVVLSIGGGGGKSETRNSKLEGNSKTETEKQPSTAGQASSGTPTTAHAEEARLKEMAAKLEAEKQKFEADKRKAEEAKLAEERRKLEEARLATEAETKKKAEIAITKVEPPPVQPDTKLTQPDTKTTQPDTTVAADRASKAQQLFSTVLQETAPLLVQNKFADAIALLERKAKDPALADAGALLKQEKADVEAVVELRRQAVEALGKLVGKQVTLKKGSGTISGKVVDDAKRDGITINVGGPEMTLRADQIHVDDIEQYAPRTGNVGADLRQRGIMYLAAGNAAKAKEYFTKPQTFNPEPYLDRITALELGEIEAAALGAWNKAEALFNRKAMKEAKDAYDAFTKQHGQTKTAAGKTGLLKERYDAIGAVVGPAKEITLDLGGAKMELVLVKAGEFMMGADDGGPEEKPVHKVKISKPYYIGKFDVTVAQFRAFADAMKFQTEAEKQNKGWTLKDGKWQEVSGVHWRNPGFKQEDNHPAVVVTWNDAQEFCKWTSKQTGREVRLPSEAQWEYAARGPSSPKYPWGDKWEGGMANVADASLRRAGFDMRWGEFKEDDGYPFTSPGGAFKNASWCGAFDMAGNVWQWCQDNWNDKYYADSPTVDPQGPSTGADRVMHGGAWDSAPSHYRCAHRRHDIPASRAAYNGFRCVAECEAAETGSRAALPEAPPPTPATPTNLQKDLPLNLGGVRMDLVLVPAGEFMMGSDDAGAKPDEKPVHKVKISKPYYIGKYDVTVAQFRAFADATKSQTEAEKWGKGWKWYDGRWQELAGVNWRTPGFPQEDNCPVVVVTWNDAQEFCKWATKLAGRTVRLPSEAEWEYAARGPSSPQYPWGDKWEGIMANVADASLRRAGFNMQWGEIKEDDGYPFTSPGGAYKNASWCGAYDMAGNVWQWCQDYFNDKYYGESPAVDPQGPANGGDRVLRGGCWHFPPGGCRSARRFHHSSGARDTYLGFRAVVVCGSSRTP